MAVRTHVILDGLQDPLHARDLSARWAAAGLINAVDVAGQCGWVELEGERHGGTEARRHEGEGKKPESGEPGSDPTPDNLNPPPSPPPPDTRHPTPESGIPKLDLAANIARAYGVEIRERVGITFRPDNDLPALREQITREYRVRFAQSLIFGLPALAVHYLGPMLASGGGQAAGSMAFPWLLELILVGWAIWVAALPIVWQGVWSLIHLRPTADLFTTSIIAIAYLPSAWGVGSLLFVDQPWFGTVGMAGVPGVPGGSEAASGGGPAFHVAIMAVMLASCQRWRMHGHIAALAQRGNYMMPRVGSLFVFWWLVMLIVWLVAGWKVMLAFGLLLPPLISSGAINRISPGWSMALPVLAFGPVFLFGPRSLPLASHAASLRFEIAAGFGWMMVGVMEFGWRRMRGRGGES